MTAGNETGSDQAESTPRKLLKSGAHPDVGRKTQFKPGVSGNPAGRPKGKSLSSTIQEMLDDPKFIDRLSKKIKERIIDADEPDPDFQGTPMRAIITTALIESIDPNIPPGARTAARDWLARYGYGTKVDVTSKGQRLSDAPKIISVVNARLDDVGTEAEAS